MEYFQPKTFWWSDRFMYVRISSIVEDRKNWGMYGRMAEMAEKIFDSHLQHDVHFSSFSFTFPAKFPTSSECPCQIAPAALFKCHISHKQLLKLFTCTTRTRTPSDRLVWIINWLKCFSFSPLWFPFFFFAYYGAYHISHKWAHSTR